MGGKHSILITSFIFGEHVAIMHSTSLGGSIRRYALLGTGGLAGMPY